MQKETLRIMASLEGRLNRLIRLELSACGFSDGVARANRQYHRMMKWLEGEIEKLVEKGGGR